MGVERAVTRWYVQRQLILDEIADLEAQQAQFQAQHPQSDQAAKTEAEQTQARLSQQLEQAREKLRLLGSCPQPMMG